MTELFSHSLSECICRVSRTGRDVDSGQERDCVRRAQAGDRAAFAALVDRYWNPVRSWLASMTRQEHLAEDLTQEAFLKAWAGLPKLAAEMTFRVWLFRIARNEFLAFARSPRTAIREELPDVPDQTPGPPQRLEEQEARNALRAAIEKLPETYRDAYLLWTHERLPYMEIADILDVTEETARWRVCEARQRLAAALRRFLGEQLR
ncbi:MAG: hypothetical protein C0467_30170 [Planctomycetaceae bacterium]|nr:hypothetical protein [Planctomycetaceae bacterium]